MSTKKAEPNPKAALALLQRMAPCILSLQMAPCILSLQHQEELD